MCLAVRQAARHVTASYDQFLAPAGLRTTQFSILAKLKRQGPMTINALAADMVMDRTTRGRNILPLELQPSKVFSSPSKPRPRPPFLAQTYRSPHGKRSRAGISSQLLTARSSQTLKERWQGRSKPKRSRVPSSHVAMLARPQQTAKLILEAAT
jgi:DNA-binding MarR family transcriptional regulator